MMRELFNNTVLGALALLVTGLLGILVVPVIVHGWGLTAYGLIILARTFIPQGLLGIADLGASEIVTRTVARACVNRDWAQASQWLGFMVVTATAAGVLMGALIYASIPLWLALFRVEAAHADSFFNILAASAAACLFLFPALVAEGIVKGFERFAALRAIEVGAAVIYVAVTVIAARLGTPFAVVAFAFLGTLIGRFIALSALALKLGRGHGLRLGLPRDRALRREMIRYVWIMTETKALGVVQNLSMPPLVGAIFGPSATGIFDLLIRLPRFAKVALSVLYTALLPVSTKIEERGAIDRMGRLGRVGLVVLPAVTVPPLVGAAILSEPILNLWIGPEIAALWPWMALMFAVPVAAQYFGFGGAAMLARPAVQALLNRLALAQIVLMAVVAIAFMGRFDERAFIVAQASAATLALPFQLWVLTRELHVSRRAVARAASLQMSIMAAAAAPALIARDVYWPESAIELGAMLAAWCAVVWSLEYALLLSPDNRSELANMARAMLDFGRRRTT